MPTIIGYGPSAFTFSGSTLRLDPNWDDSDAFDFVVTDEDSQFQGDRNVNESGDDTTQDAIVRDETDATVASGQVYLEDRFTFTDPDGNTINLYRVEIGGTHVGYVADGEIQPGVTYSFSTTNVTDNDAPSYSGFVDATYDNSVANTIEGGSLNDTLVGGDGDDSLDGGSNNGDDILYGGAGNDSFAAVFGGNTMYGGDDADTFNVGFGVDTLYGGEGGDDRDTLSGVIPDDALTITLTGDEQGTFVDSDGDNGSFEGIENLRVDHRG